jgi:NAD+ kinase
VTGAGDGEAATPAVPSPDALERVLVVSTRFKPAAHPPAREVEQMLNDRGIEARLCLNGDGDLHHLAQGCQLVIAVGGDGTLLGIARRLQGAKVPTIGLNIGKLGFLAEFDANDIRAYLESGEAPFEVIPRVMLRCRLEGHELLALNDIVLAQGPLTRILTIEMAIDGRRATTYHADGVVISTPVGSTGYSLSLGGPILTPAMQALLVTPIAPHALTNRPLVLSGASRLSFRVLRESPSLSLLMDGQELIPLSTGAHFEVDVADARFYLVSHRERTFFDVLRRKLHWSIRPSGAREARPSRAAGSPRPTFAAVYLHGFASDPEGRKAKAISSALRERGIPIAVPDLNQGEGGFEGLTITRMLASTRKACQRVRRLAALPADAPVVLIGSSLGGYVASLLASEDASVVGLFLMAPAFDFARSALARLTDEARQELAASGSLPMHHYGEDRPARASKALFDDGATYAAFPDVTCPTVILHGRNDESVPVRLTETFADGRRNVHVVVVEDGHRLRHSLDTVEVALTTFIEKLFA